MRILLDESLPRQLIRLLPEHEVHTVAAMGWTGIRNGPLLQLAAGEFDAFLTADQNLEHQQNLGTLPIAVVVLVAPTNQIESLRPLVPALPRVLETLRPRQLVQVTAYLGNTASRGTEVHGACPQKRGPLSPSRRGAAVERDRDVPAGVSPEDRHGPGPWSVVSSGADAGSRR